MKREKTNKKNVSKLLLWITVGIFIFLLFSFLPLFKQKSNINGLVTFNSVNLWDYSLKAVPTYSMAATTTTTTKTTTTTTSTTNTPTTPPASTDTIATTTPTTLNSPSNTLTTIAAPGVATKNKCCICYYPDIRVCPNQKNPDDCKKYSPECMWSGTECFSVSTRNFKKICEEWFKKPEQADCNNPLTIPLPIYSGNQPNELPIPGNLEYCSDINAEIALHSDPTKCQSVFEFIQLCLNKAPDCNTINLDVSGCLTFNNLTAALKFASDLKRKLGDGKCVTISANQCAMAANVDLGETCTSKFTINIDSKSCTTTAGDCDYYAKCVDFDNAAVCHETENGIDVLKCKLCITSTGKKPKSVFDPDLVWRPALISECNKKFFSQTPNPIPTPIPTTTNTERTTVTTSSSETQSSTPTTTDASNPETPSSSASTTTITTSTNENPSSTSTEKTSPTSSSSASENNPSSGFLSTFKNFFSWIFGK